jgi:tRNA threonylcarbamoyladenosine biosynthesis protein TsaE
LCPLPSLPTDEHIWTAADLEELQAVAREILRHCPGIRNFALSGELGAGKTALVRAFCQQLGLDTAGLSSPSFGIAHEYGPEPLVFHLDLYRLRDPSELQGIGLERYLDGPEYCFIEWPQLAEGWLDSDTAQIALSVGPGAVRTIVLRKG